MAAEEKNPNTHFNKYNDYEISDSDTVWQVLKNALAVNKQNSTRH